MAAARHAAVSEPRKLSAPPSQPYARLKSLWCRRENPDKARAAARADAGLPKSVPEEDEAGGREHTCHLAKGHGTGKVCSKCGGHYAGFGTVCPKCRAAGAQAPRGTCAGCGALFRGFGDRCEDCRPQGMVTAISAFGGSSVCSMEPPELTDGCSSQSGSDGGAGPFDRGPLPRFTLTVGRAPSGDSETAAGSEVAGTLSSDGLEEAAPLPLLEAALAGDLALLEALCADGEGVNRGNVEGVTPLLCATIVGSQALVAALLRRGADPNVADAFGATPLQAAAFDGHAALARLLLAAGAEVDAADADGCTALHFAVLNACGESGYQQVLGELLAARADPALCARDGTSARVLAESYTSSLDMLRVIGGD